MVDKIESNIKGRDGCKFINLHPYFSLFRLLRSHSLVFEGELFHYSIFLLKLLKYSPFPEGIVPLVGLVLRRL
jgi:hypothetical protein